MASTTVRPRLDSLTGLRFFAALAVFGLHLDLLLPMGGYKSLYRFVVQGGTGVSFFFVLSGFVLTWSHREGDTAAGFMRRRFARIVPSQVVMWGVAGIVLAAVATRASPGQSIASLFMISPWIPKVSLIETLNVPAWSLGCEMFFYALFPIAFSVLSRRSSPQRRTLMVGMVLIVAVLAVVLAPATFPTTRYWGVYFFPPARLPEFLLGMMLAMEVSANRWPRLPVGPTVAVAAGTYLACGWIAWPYSTVLVTLVPFTLLVGAVAQRDSAPDPPARSPFLAWRPVVLLGTWSFAFYIVHWPVLVVLGSTLPKHFSVPGRVLLAVGALGLVLAAAAALHYVVEVPFERALRTPRPARATWAWRGSVPAFSGLLAVVAVAASAEAVVPVSTHGTRSGQAVVAQAVAPLAPSSVAKQGARPGPGQPSGPAGTSTAQGRQPPVQTGTNQPAKPASAPSSTTANPGSGPRSTPVTVPGVKLADCTASQLAQTITTDRPRYTAGQQVSIRLLALNRSTEPCVLAPPACYPEMTVVASASSLTWSIPFVDQGRCKQFSPVTLQPGQETSVVTSWDVNYCPTVAPAASTCRNAVTTVPAPPGSYQAQGLWLVDEAGGPTAVFIIS